MGSYAHYAQLYSNIRKANPNLTRQQVKEKMEFYITQIMTSPLSEEEILALIEQRPRPGVAHPRPMRRFTQEEREIRRAKSAAVRVSMLNHIDNEEHHVEDLRIKGNELITRDIQRLIRMEVFGATEDEKAQIRAQNAEVLRLFDTQPQNQAENIAAMRSELRQSNPNLTDDEADQLIAQRRAQIVLNRMQVIPNVIQHLDELTDPNLPAEELARNFYLVADALHMCGDAAAYINSIPKWYTMSKAEIEWIRDQYAHLNTLTIALQKMRMIANPAYEFLDLDALQDYEVHDIANGTVEDADGFATDGYEYKTVYSDDAVAFRSQQKEKDPEHFDTYMQKVSDNVANILDDEYFRYENIGEQNLDVALRSQKYTPKDVTVFRTTFNIPDKQFIWEETTIDIVASSILKGVPAAVCQHDRVTVFQRVNGVIAPAADPGILFGYDLAEKLEFLTEKMSTADPWYHPSSKIFKAMKKAFKDAKRYGKISENGDPKAAKEYYQALFEAADAYLKTKPDNPTDKWTKRHVEIGKLLRDFADGKRRALDYVEQARRTARRYKGMSPEERHNAIIMDDKIADDAKNVMARKADRTAHQEDPLKWVNDRISKVYQGSDIPIPLLTQLTQAQEAFQTLSDNPAEYENNLADARSAVAHLVGTMIACEFVMKEGLYLKTSAGGTLRTLYTAATKDDLIKLGEKAMISLTGKGFLAQDDPDPDDSFEIEQPAKIAADELKEFVIDFQPEELMERLADDVYQANEISRIEQKLTGQYINPIKPLRTFTLDNYESALLVFTDNCILEPVTTHLPQGEKNAILPAEEARLVLGSCVLHSMIQLERSASGLEEAGYFESFMARNPEEGMAFRERICGTDSFRKVLAYYGDNDGNLSQENFEKLIGEKAPQKIAVTLMKEFAKEQQDYLKQQKQARQERKQLEREKQEKERLEKEKQEKEQQEKERLEKEKQSQQQPKAPGQQVQEPKAPEQPKQVQPK